MSAHTQVLTGTWEGELLTSALNQGGDRPRISTGVPMTRHEESPSAGVISGLARSSKMAWELVQVNNKIYGIVFFYPQDTKLSDKPISRYTWEGELHRNSSSAFTFIQGRLLDGTSLRLEFYPGLTHFTFRALGTEHSNRSTLWKDPPDFLN
jgi:hypothetical protein